MDTHICIVCTGDTAKQAWLPSLPSRTMLHLIWAVLVHFDGRVAACPCRLLQDIDLCAYTVRQEGGGGKLIQAGITKHYTWGGALRLRCLNIYHLCHLYVLFVSYQGYSRGTVFLASTIL